MKKKLPKYVRLGHTEMRLVDKTKQKQEYFRDAGSWSTDYKYLDETLVADFEGMPWIHEQPLIEITKDEWKKGNKGYI